MQATCPAITNRWPRSSTADRLSFLNKRNVVPVTNGTFPALNDGCLVQLMAAAWAGEQADQFTQVIQRGFGNECTVTANVIHTLIGFETTQKKTHQSSECSLPVKSARQIQRKIGHGEPHDRAFTYSTDGAQFGEC